jgi:peptide/nickel transport system permease protein
MTVSDTAISGPATEGRRGLTVPRRLGALIAGSLLALVVLAVIAAPLLTSYGPYTIDPANAFQPPSSAHWFGTDELGRDIFSRMLYGGRVTLGAALGATALSMVLGIAWGFAAALGVSLLDEVLMRTADVAMAIPQILFGLVFIAAFGTSLLNLVVIVGILLSPTSGRLVRSVVLAEREADYVRAAVAFGATRWSIAAKEIFPNTTSHLAVLAAINMANALLLEASFSFVGLGVQPPRASWGTILQQGYVYIYDAFYYALFPALAIVLVMLLLNVLARSLQSSPRTRM